MAVTLVNNLADGLYKVRINHRDSLKEEVAKNFRVSNVDAQLNLALTYYDDISQAGIIDLGVTLDAEPAGASTASTQLGQFSKVGDMLVLAFYRNHPLDATKLVTNEFVIIAPVTAIYSEVTYKPVADLEADMTTATPTAIQKMGALINWLQDSLVMESFGTVYVGGWTYDETNSRLIGIPKTYDGNPRT